MRRADLEHGHLDYVPGVFDRRWSRPPWPRRPRASPSREWRTRSEGSGRIDVCFYTPSRFFASASPGASKPQPEAMTRVSATRWFQRSDARVRANSSVAVW